MNLTQQINELLAVVVNILLIPILPVLAAFIIAYLKKKTAELEADMNNTELEKYSDLADQAVSSAVSAVNQTFVDGIKNRSSSLTPYEQKAAFEMAREKALRIIGNYGVEVLKALYRDFDAWLENRIEYYVKKNKTGSGVQESQEPS